MEAARHLVALPDPQTGELIETNRPNLEARIVQLEDELHEAQRMSRSQAHRIGVMLRDEQAESEASPHWPFCARLFAWHQKLCNHPRAEWSHKRFLLALPFLRSRKHGREACLRAVYGRSQESWYRQHRKDMWEDIFGDHGKFERCLSECPEAWQPPQSARAML